jgi:hypothetical protein
MVVACILDEVIFVHVIQDQKDNLDRSASFLTLLTVEILKFVRFGATQSRLWKLLY